MRLGSLQLESNLFLSPLAGYTNLPFRLVVRELGGAGLATTDLVNARSLLEKKPKALKLVETCPADRPLAVQLFGSVPEEMRDAAVYLESTGVASAGSLITRGVARMIPSGVSISRSSSGVRAHTVTSCRSPCASHAANHASYRQRDEGLCRIGFPEE